MRRIWLLLAVSLSTLSVAQIGDWQLVNQWGIDLGGDHWLSGRVTDVAPITADQVLVTTDSAGVWLATRNSALPLSKDWVSTTTTSIARDRSSSVHFYVGGATSAGRLGAMYETDRTVATPLYAPWKPVTLMPNTGTIRKILVMSKVPRIVIATDSGIYWAPIPPAGESPRWVRPDGLGTMPGSYLDIEEGPGNTIIAGGRFINSQLVGGSLATNNVGQVPIRVGSWGLLAKNLKFENASIKLVKVTYTPADLLTTSIGVSPSDPNVMYAYSAGTMNGSAISILKSVDGGRNWTNRAGLMPNNETLWMAKNRGLQMHDRNNCITVSPTDPNLIFLGAIRLYSSTDGGTNLTELRAPHNDHASLSFFGNDLFDCSDGGLAVTSDAGTTWDFRFNRKLATLQFYGGTSGISSGTPTILSGGLQDNDNIVSTDNPLDNFGPWKAPAGARFDGGGSIILFDKTMIFANGGGYYQSSKLQNGVFPEPTPITTSGMQPADLSYDAATKVSSFLLKDVRIISVPRPGAKLDGYSIEAFGIKDLGDTSVAHIARMYALIRIGSAFQWRVFGKVDLLANVKVNTIGTYDGTTLYVGLSGSAGIIKLEHRPSPTADTIFQTPQSGIPRSADSSIQEIVVNSRGDAYAILDNSFYNTGAVYMSGQNNAWRLLNGAPSTYLRGLIAPTDTELFVSTSNMVYGSIGNPDNWRAMGRGLPRTPSLTGLSMQTDRTGKRYLYAFTYGWSVWRVAM